jgi:hypothetical protein
LNSFFPTYHQQLKLNFFGEIQIENLPFTSNNLGVITTDLELLSVILIIAKEIIVIKANHLIIVVANCNSFVF